MTTILLTTAAAIASVTWSAASAPALPDAMVALHDGERDRVGAPHLEWDDGLAREAAAWATHLAATDTFAHDQANTGHGENLWMGTRGAYTLGEMVGGWTEERTPLAAMRSWEDDYHRVGHYTQMVWGNTRRVGCAVATSRTNDILVCRYWPAGNVIGQQP